MVTKICDDNIDEEIQVGLTHLPLDKMVTILADNIFRDIFVNKKCCILIKISLMFVPKGPIDNNPALV